MEKSEKIKILKRGFAANGFSTRKNAERRRPVENLIASLDMVGSLVQIADENPNRFKSYFYNVLRSDKDITYRTYSFRYVMTNEEIGGVVSAGVIPDGVKRTEDGYIIQIMRVYDKTPSQVLSRATNKTKRSFNKKHGL